MIEVMLSLRKLVLFAYENLTNNKSNFKDSNQSGGIKFFWKYSFYDSLNPYKLSILLNDLQQCLINTSKIFIYPIMINSINELD